ncbi:MAG: Ku protein [Armatimonadota bacterium]
MVRAIWTGAISFGLVAIPVKAVPAQSGKDIRFSLIHQPCHTRISTRKYCPHCEREVSGDELVRGFEYTKGEYVLVEDEELQGLATPAKHTLQILDFVEMSQVDPVYFERPYYLQPGAGGDRTYALLHQAMTESGRVGVGKVALRDREHLALVRPMKHALVMELISFPDEVRSVEEVVAPPEVRVDERELKMAEFLIESMSAPFEPEKYRDDYREELTRLIEAKVEGGTVRARKAPDRETRGEVVDLLDVLRRSVEAAGGGAEGASELAEERKPAKRQRTKKAA